MDICVDFDGTCVFHRFPNIGDDVPHAVNVLKEIIKNGHNIILFTMRSNRLSSGDTGDKSIKDVTGRFLDDAVKWFKDRDIPLYGIQTNPTQKNWTTSPKAYGQIYIDDAAIGCPTFIDYETGRQYVNWAAVRAELVEIDIIKE